MLLNKSWLYKNSHVLGIGGGVGLLVFGFVLVSGVIESTTSAISPATDLANTELEITIDPVLSMTTSTDMGKITPDS